MTRTIGRRRVKITVTQATGESQEPGWRGEGWGSEGPEAASFPAEPPPHNPAKPEFTLEAMLSPWEAIRG